MRDALFLVHPKAKDEAQQVLFDKIFHALRAIEEGSNAVKMINTLNL